MIKSKIVLSVQTNRLFSWVWFRVFCHSYWYLFSTNLSYRI